MTPDTPQDDRELLTGILVRLERIEAALHSPASRAHPQHTAREAAAYLRISYSTFRKKATRIKPPTRHTLLPPRGPGRVRCDPE